MPDRVDQILLGDELSRPSDELFEHAERLRAELDEVGILPETLVHRVEGERTEMNAVFAYTFRA